MDTLISVVKDSIKRAGVSRTSQNRDLQVASVQLILDVVASKTAGNGLDFRVPFIGMKVRIRSDAYGDPRAVVPRSP